MKRKSGSKPCPRTISLIEVQTVKGIQRQFSIDGSETEVESGTLSLSNVRSACDVARLLRAILRMVLLPLIARPSDPRFLRMYRA